MSELLRELLLSQWSMPGNYDDKHDPAPQAQQVSCSQSHGDVNDPDGDKDSAQTTGGKSMAMVLPSLTTLRKKLNLSNGLAGKDSQSQEGDSPATCSSHSGAHSELPQTTCPGPPDDAFFTSHGTRHVTSGVRTATSCHYSRDQSPEDLPDNAPPPDIGIKRSPKVKIFQKKVKPRPNVFEQMQAGGALATFDVGKSNLSHAAVVYHGSAPKETVVGVIKTPRPPQRHGVTGVQNVYRKKKHRVHRHSSLSSPSPSSSASRPSLSSSSSSLSKLPPSASSLPVSRNIFESATFTKPPRPPPAHSQALPANMDPNYSMPGKHMNTHLQDVPRSREPITSMVPLDLSKVSTQDPMVTKSRDSRSGPQKDTTSVDVGESPLDLSVKKRPLSGDRGGSELESKPDEPAQKKQAVEVVAVCGKMKFTRPVHHSDSIGKVNPSHVQTGITFGTPRLTPVGIATATKHPRDRLTDPCCVERSDTPRPAHLPPVTRQGVNTPPLADIPIPREPHRVPSAHSCKQGTGRRSPILPSGGCSVNPSSLNAQSVVNVRGRSFKVSPVRPQVNGKTVITSRTFPISNVPSSLSSSAPSSLSATSVSSTPSSTVTVNGTIGSGTIGCLQLNNIDGLRHRFAPPLTPTSQPKVASSSKDPNRRPHQVPKLSGEKINLTLDQTYGMANAARQTASPDLKDDNEHQDLAESSSQAPLLNIPTYKPSKPKSKVRKRSRPPLYVNIPERINADVPNSPTCTASQPGSQGRQADPLCVSASTQTSGEGSQVRKPRNVSVIHKKSRFPHPQGTVMVARKSTTQVNKRLLQQYLESRSPPKLAVMSTGRSVAPSEPLTSPKNMPVLSPHRSPPILLPQISPPSKNDKTLETATTRAGHSAAQPVVKTKDLDCDNESMKKKVRNVLLLSGGVAKTVIRDKSDQETEDNDPMTHSSSSPPLSSIMYSSRSRDLPAGGNLNIATRDRSPSATSSPLCFAIASTDNATSCKDLSISDNDLHQDSPCRISALSSTTPLSQTSTPYNSHTSSPRSTSPCSNIAAQERLLAKFLVSRRARSEGCGSPTAVAQDAAGSSAVSSESEDDTPLSVIRAHMSLKSDHGESLDSIDSAAKQSTGVSEALPIGPDIWNSAKSTRKKKETISSNNAESSVENILVEATPKLDKRNAVMLSKAYPKVNNLSAFMSTIDDTLTPLSLATMDPGTPSSFTTPSSPASLSDIEQTQYYHSNILRGSLNKSNSSPALNTLGGRAQTSPRILAASASNTPKYTSLVSEEQPGDHWQSDMFSFKREHLRIPPHLITLPRTASSAVGKRLSPEGLYDFWPSSQYGKAKATMAGMPHTPVLTPIKKLLVPTTPHDFIRMATIDISRHMSSKNARTVAEVNRARELANQRAELEQRMQDFQENEVGTWTMVTDVSPRKPGSPAAAHGKESSGTLVTVLRRDKSRDETSRDSLLIARSPVETKCERPPAKDTLKPCMDTKQVSSVKNEESSKDAPPPAKLTLKCEKGLPFVQISPLKKKISKLPKPEKTRVKCSYTIKEEPNENTAFNDSGCIKSPQPKLSPIRLVASPPRKKKSQKKSEPLPSTSDTLSEVSPTVASTPVSSPTVYSTTQPLPKEKTIKLPPAVQAPTEKPSPSPEKSKSKKKTSVEIANPVIQEPDIPEVKAKSSTPKPVSKECDTKPSAAKGTTPKRKASTPKKGARMKEEQEDSIPTKVAKKSTKVREVSHELPADIQNVSKKKKKSKKASKLAKNMRAGSKEEGKKGKAGAYSLLKRKAPRKTRSLKSIRAMKEAAKRKKEQEEEEERRRKKKRRSMLDELANSDGYVAEKRLEKKCTDLYADPSQLGREERALLRAMRQFSEMEQNPQAHPRGNPKKQEQTSARKKAQALTKSALKRARNQCSPRKSKFDDFVPEILVTRTRTQTAADGTLAVPSSELTGIRKARPTTLSYHKDNAYENELRREEDRRKYLRARRKARLAVTRILLLSSARSCPGRSGETKGATTLQTEGPDKVAGPGVLEHGTDEGCWEILATACEKRRRRARNQASAANGGRLTLKLHWRPSRLLKKAQKYVRDKRQNTAKTSARKKFFMGLRMRRRRRARKARQKNVKQEEVVVEDVEAENVAGPVEEKEKVAVVDVEGIDEAAPVALPGMKPEEKGGFPPAGVPVLAEDPHPVPECVKKMSVNQNTGETILHKAARLGYEDVAKYCAETKYVDLDARDHAGYTAMHECCSQGHLAVASYLIGGGASVNLQSCDGMRPLHDAVENGLMEMVRLLLSCGADPKLATYGGKTVLGLTNVREITDYLNGYFQDLNGCKQHQPELAWQFQGSAPMEDAEEESGLEVLADIPPEDEDQAPDDPEFDFSEEHPDPTYFIALDPIKGACNYLLAQDLLVSLHLTQSELEKKHPDLQLVTAAVEDITSSCQCLSPETIAHLEQAQDSFGKVALVELTDRVRRLTAITSEHLSEVSRPEQSAFTTFRRYRAEPPLAPVSDPEDVYDWDEQFTRATADYQLLVEDGRGPVEAAPSMAKEELYRALFSAYEEDEEEDGDAAMDEDYLTDAEDGVVSEYSEHVGESRTGVGRPGPSPDATDGCTFEPIDTVSDVVGCTMTSPRSYHGDEGGYESQRSPTCVSAFTPASPGTLGSAGELVITEVRSLSRGGSPPGDAQSASPTPE